MPGHAVLEMGAPQQVGEMLGFGPLGVERAHDDQPVAVRPGRGDGPMEGLAGRRVDGARQREPAGDPLRGEQEPRPEAARRPQRDHVGRRAVGAWERGGELQDAPHLGAAERVDRLVRVAHRHQVAPVAGQRAQQGHLPGVGVLVLVDEDVLEPRPQLVAVHLRLDRGSADQVGVVGEALVVEVGEVELQEPARGHELGQVVLLPQPRQRLTVEPLLPGAGEHGVHLTCEAASAQRRAQ